MPFVATWVNLEIIILNEVSHSEKDKSDITYMWKIKSDTNLFMKQKQTHRHR